MKETRLKGTIKYWNGRKGFGFIEPDGEDTQVFVHIKAFTVRKGKPLIGQIVTYTLSEDEQGRLRADNVLDEADSAALEKSSTMTLVVSIVVVVAVIAVAAILWL